MLERALEEARGCCELEAEILARLSFAALDPRRGVAYADAAMRLLSEEREPALLGSVLITRFARAPEAGESPPRELFERGLALEARAKGSNLSSLPLIWFQCVDEFDAARARHAAENQWYRDLGDDGACAERLSWLALVELHAGRWDLAEEYAEGSVATIYQVDARGPGALPAAWRSFIDAHRGRIDRGRSKVLELIETWDATDARPWTALLLSVLGFVEFAAGDAVAADRALTEMRARLDANGATETLLDRSEPFHVEALVALGEHERARDVLHRLEERGRRLPRLWIDVTLPRARALVLAADSDLVGALDALDELDVDRASQLPFELGWALLVKGRLHRRLKQKRAAADALREALEIFERLGSPPWIESTRREIARVGLRRAAGWDLTETERRVAELAAAGRTNREIAQTLFISPKTVEANLARVYRKLAIGSRAELGARMGEGA
jgi:DNA-binding CsgD family transcriptional regulator